MAYYRGDYYRSRGRMGGDYYMGAVRRGDPFWGLIGRAITAVGRFALGIPAKGTAQAAGAATAGAATGAAVSGLPAVLKRLPLPSRQVAVPAAAVAGAVVGRVGRFAQRAAALVAAGLAYEVGGRIFDAVTGREIKPHGRRMNPANVKALRRSIRRVVGFGKLCAQARSSVGKAATQLQYGRRHRGGSSSRAIATASSRR